MRLFFAVDMPALPAWASDSPETEGPSETAPPHLTLRFLGEQPEAALAELERAGAEATVGLSSIAVDLEMIGAFPSKRAPRIVWLGVGTGREDLIGLERQLSRALSARGIPAEPREFVPHVTWRRLRSRHDALRAREWLEKGALSPPRKGEVRALLLKESVLSPQGARHRVVATFPLGERTDADQAGSRPTSS